MILSNDIRTAAVASLVLSLGFSACGGGGGGGAGTTPKDTGGSKGTIAGSVKFDAGSKSAGKSSGLAMNSRHGDDREPNNNLFQVRDLGQLAGRRTVRGTVDSTDRVDFFRFHVQHAGHVKVGIDARDTVLLAYLVRGGKGQPEPLARTTDGGDLEISVAADDHVIVGVEASEAAEGAGGSAPQAFAISLQLVAGFATATAPLMTAAAIAAAVESLLPARVEVMPGEVIVRFDSDVVTGLYRAGMNGLEQVSSGGGYHLMRTLNPIATQDTRSGRQALGNLLFDLRRNLPPATIVEPNYRFRDTREPNDKYYQGGQGNWHHKMCNMPAAWDITTGNGVVVAVLDTGVVGRHVDLSANVLANDGYDFVDNDRDAEEPMQRGSSWHGTHVAGIIAATTNNSIGVAGVGWNTKILPVRVLGPQGGSAFSITQGILYAAGLPNQSGRLPQNKAKIVNMSLGSSQTSVPIKEACQKAQSAGAIIVAAVGNDFQKNNPTSYPAAYPGVIGVGAVGPTKRRAYYSNTGSYVDIVAPGGDTSNGKSGGILSTVLVEDKGQFYAAFDYMQGSSMACPFASGVMALMLGKNPNMTATDILDVFSKTSTDLGVAGKDPEYGFGLIDAAAALNVKNGGGNPNGSIRAATNKVTFAAGGSEQRVAITAVNGGNLPLTLAPVTNAGWLTATLTGTSTPADLRLVVNRASLAAGTYRASVKVTSDKASVVIDVVLTIDQGVTLPSMATVQLLDANKRVVTSVTTDAAGAYQLQNVTAGEYTIRIGVDSNNDGSFGDKGDWRSADRSLVILPGENLQLPAITASYVAQ